jgi:hypothetical protein
VGTTTFWRLVFAFAVVILGQSTLGVHRIPNFMDRGFDPTLVAYATAFDAGAAGASLFTLGSIGFKSATWARSGSWQLQWRSS